MTLLTQGEAVSGNKSKRAAPSLVRMPLSLIGSSANCMHDMHKSHARGHQPPSSFDLILEALFRADQVFQWGFSLSSDKNSLASQHSGCGKAKYLGGGGVQGRMASTAWLQGVYVTSAERS